MYALKLCYRSVRAKPVSGNPDPVYGINKRTLSFVEGITRVSVRGTLHAVENVGGN